MRTLTALLFLLTLTSTPVSAAPSIGELFGKVAESNDKVVRAAADVARARAAYQEQQAKVLAAAAALFGAKPNAEPPRSRLARLLELRTPGTSAPRPVLLRSRPMKPSDRLASLRKANPSGRKISPYRSPAPARSAAGLRQGELPLENYDRLTFRR